MRCKFSARLLFAVTLALVGCSKTTYEGKYVADGNDKIYLQLKATDSNTGTWSGSGPYTGTYVVRDGSIYLTENPSGNNAKPEMVAIGRIDEKGIYCSYYYKSTAGQRFIKQASMDSGRIAAQNTSSSGKLAKANAQTALEKWVRTKNGGAVEVIGIQELPQENAAKADIKFTDLDWYKFQSFDSNSPSDYHYSGSGVAIFTQYNDGRWILSRVQVGQDYRTKVWDALNIEVQ